MTDTAVILAGGLGTRLKAVLPETPKPLAPVAGRPFIRYLLHFLARYGVNRVIVSAGYRSEMIVRTLGKTYDRMTISYAIETVPMGTGGGLRLALEQSDAQTVVALNGDSIFNMPLDAFYRSHETSGARVSIALRSVGDVSRYGAIETDAHHRVVSFTEKESKSGKGRVNGGVYMIDRAWFLSETPAHNAFSLEKDFFGPRAGKGEIAAFEYDGYFIDIGIPADYARAQHELEGFEDR